MLLKEFVKRISKYVIHLGRTVFSHGKKVIHHTKRVHRHMKRVAYHGKKLVHHHKHIFLSGSHIFLIILLLGFFHLNGMLFADSGDLADVLVVTTEITSPSDTESTVVVEPESISGDIQEVVVDEMLNVIEPDILTGDILTGDILTGDVLTGDILTGDVLTGDVLTGDVLTGDVLTGDVLTGEVLTGDVLTGDVLTGEVLTGEVLTGDVLTGEVFTGEALTGEVLTGEVLLSGEYILLVSTGTVTDITGDFRPDQVDGLLAWLDPSIPGSMTLSGNNVLEWRDRMGHGIKAFMHDMERSPWLIQNVVSGRPALFFDDEDDGMETNISLDGPYTIFLVYNIQRTSIDTAYVIQGFNDWYVGTLGNKFMYYASGIVSNVYPYTNSQFKIVSLANDTNQSDFFVGLDDFTQNNFYTEGPDGLLLGSNGLTGDYPIGGYIAEVIIFDNVLSSGDREGIIGYLQDKYFDLSSMGGWPTLIINNEEGTGDSVEVVEVIEITEVIGTGNIQLKTGDLYGEGTVSTELTESTESIEGTGDNQTGTIENFTLPEEEQLTGEVVELTGDVVELTLDVQIGVVDTGYLILTGDYFVDVFATGYFNSVFVSGDVSEKVTVLQELLEYLGFYTGAVTSTFDAVTKEAVYQFQLSENILTIGDPWNLRGYMGPLTKNALNSELENYEQWLAEQGIVNSTEELITNEGQVGTGDVEGLTGNIETGGLVQETGSLIQATEDLKLGTGGSESVPIDNVAGYNRSLVFDPMENSNLFNSLLADTGVNSLLSGYQYTTGNVIEFMFDALDEESVIDYLTQRGYDTSTLTLVPVDYTAMIGDSDLDLSLLSGRLLVPIVLQSTNELEGKIAEVEIPEGAILKTADGTVFTGSLQAPVFEDSTLVDVQFVDEVISVVDVGADNYVEFEDENGNSVYATFRIPVPGKNIGDEVEIYYSEDYVNFYYLTTVRVQDIKGEPYAVFVADHFTVFVAAANNGSSVGYANDMNARDAINNTYASRDIVKKINPDSGNYLLMTTSNASELSGAISQVEIGFEGYSEKADIVGYIIPVFNGTMEGNEYNLGTLSLTDTDTTIYADITTDPQAPETWTWNDIINLDVKAYGGNTHPAQARFVYIDQINVRVSYSDSGDVIPPTAVIEYTPGFGALTSGDVLAIITGFSESITGLNATGYTFTGNGSFVFTFQDLAGNTGSATGTVTWIDSGWLLEQQIIDELVSLGYQTGVATLASVEDTVLIGISDVDFSSLDGNLLVPVIFESTNDLNGQGAEVEIPAGAVLKDSIGSAYTGVVTTPVFQDTVSASTALGKQVFSAIDVGSNKNIKFKDKNGNSLPVTFRMPVPGKQVGDLVDIYYSQDGVDFSYLSTVSVKNIQGNPYVVFSADHFTVFVTVASNGTSISADLASNAASPVYTALNDIVITEGDKADFAANQTNTTLILTAPSNWRFSAGSGSVSNAGSYPSSADITALSINVTSSTITVTLSTDANANKLDVLNIAGIRVQAISGNLIPSAGNILRTSANPGTATIAGITNDVTNFGSLSQVAGVAKNMITTLPGQTFAAGLGNSGAALNQTAGVSFDIVGLTTIDQFTNISDLYSGSKTISYTGPAGTYTTNVSFVDGQSTTTLATTLSNSGTNVTITASDGVLVGVASSAFDVIAVADVTPPILLEITPVPTPTNDTTPDYTFSSDEVGNISYSGDCSSIMTGAISGNNTVTFNTLLTGIHNNCKIRVTDLALNDSDRLTVSSFTIDTTPPSISFTDDVEAGPVSGDIITASWGDATVTKWMYDSDGVCSTNSGDYTYTGSVSMNQTNETNNTNYICLYAEDSLGNDSQLASANVINIDITGPTASVGYTPGSGAFTSGNVLATLTGFSETLTGLNATGYLFTGNGDFIFTFEDLAGNAGSATATVTWIDKTAPTASVDYDPATDTSGDVLATLTGFSETLTGLNATGYLFTGNGDFIFTFEDLAGNTGSTTATVNWIYRLLNFSASALDSSGVQIGTDESAFKTDNLEEIEFMKIEFEITSPVAFTGHPIIYFTADGTNACSLGNKQNGTCYAYDSSTWIEYQIGQETSTFKDEGAQGDYIDCTYTGNLADTGRNYTCIIDEHYNPNVFKWYDAGYDFSDVKWQNGDQKIREENMIMVELDQSKIPTNADQYKLDFRVNAINDPNQPLEAYLCNSSYGTGNPAYSANCEIVTTKMPAELQDDGTKFRGIFTDNLITSLGDIKYVILHADEADISKYYSLKTYKSTSTGWSTKWDYSTDHGDNWTNSSDGYETELNINRFYNGGDPTAVIFDINYSGISLGENSVVWDILPNHDYAPIVDILTPYYSSTVSGNYNISWMVNEPNSEDYLVDVTLSGGSGPIVLGTGLGSGVTDMYWDTTVEDDGIWELTMEACEVAGLETILCSSDVHTFTVFNNNPPIITSDGGGNTADIAMNENQILVTIVTSSDADSGATAIYSLSGGADVTAFSIESITGTLNFNVAPDYEIPIDSGVNNTYEVIVVVTDQYGLTDQQTITVTINDLDEIAPTFAGVTSGATYTGAVTITFSDANLSGAILSGLNGNSYYSGDFQSGSTVSGNGEYIFTVYDLAGNSTGATFTIGIDTTPPSISFTDDVVAGPVSGDTITVDRDDATVTKWMYDSDGVCSTNSGDYTYTGGVSMNQTDETNNTNYICLYAEDSVGNDSQLASSNDINIDAASPTATVSYDPATLTSGNVLAIVTGFSEQVTGLNATGYTFTGNGVFTFEFEDAVGNTGSTTATVTWIDKTSPTATVSYDPLTVTSGNVIATISGSESITVTNNGGSTGYTFTGNGVFTFEFVDLIGHTGSTTATVTWIDKTSPVITGLTTNPTLPIYNTGVQQNIRFDFESDSYPIYRTMNLYSSTGLLVDSVGEYIFASSGDSPDVYTLRGASFADGIYSLYYSVRDEAVNITTGYVGDVTVDKTSPTATVSYDPVILTSGNVVAIVTGFSETITGLNVTGYTFTGNNNFVFTFQDLAGNTGSITASVTWIDKTLPTFAGVSSGTYYNTGVSITFSDANLSGATLNGSLYVSGTLITGDGTYVFVVSDFAGNNTGATFTIDQTNPVITLNGSSTINVEYGSSYTELGATRTDTTDGSGDVSTISGSVDTGTLGVYILTYIYVDTSGNTGSDDRTVNVVDTTAPIVTLSGASVINIWSGDNYIEPGATWTDLYDGSGFIVNATSGSVNTGLAGTYILTYSKVDSSNNTGSITRTVNVLDGGEPIVILSGALTVNVEYGSNYTEFGATRTDNTDGTGDVSIISGIVDTGTLGTYILTYIYVNSLLVTGSIDRTVNVVDTIAPIVTLNGSATINIERLSPYTESGATWTDLYDGTGSISTPTSGLVNTGIAGTYILTYIYVDSSGNTGSDDRTVNVVDTVLPTASVSYDPLTLTSGNVVATISGSESITVTNNGGSTGYTFTGNGVFTFEFEDGVGNTGSKTAIVTWIDKTSPTATVSYDPAVATSGNVIATISGSEVITVTNNGGSTGYTFTGNGVFVFTFEDLAGNTGRATSTVTWIDKTSPTATVVYSTTGLTNGDVVATVTGFSETVTGLNATGYLFTGNGSFVFTFQDLAGNTGSVTAAVTWIDKTSPTATVSYDPVTLTSGNVVATITGFSETVTGLNVTGYLFTGNGSFEFTFEDLAGNTGSETATVTWIAVPSIPVVVPSPSGGGSYVLIKDECRRDPLSKYNLPWANRDGIDYSPSYYDRKCERRTLEDEIEYGEVTDLGSIEGSHYAPDVNQAYLYSYDIGLVGEDTIQGASMDDLLLRKDAARMMSEYAIRIVGLTPDYNKRCDFNDVVDESQEAQYYIRLACKLGIMGLQSNGIDVKDEFMPNKIVTRAEFGTVISRLLWGNKYDNKDPYYVYHLAALKSIGIVKYIEPNVEELRGWAMLMMMRISVKDINNVKHAAPTLNGAEALFDY